jgi:hypothetical protein
MAERLGARKNSSWNAICMAPDFCKTPMGPNVIPIPYMIIADLGQSDNTVPNVRFNGDPCKVLDQSIVPCCTGDEPGTAGGMRSGTFADRVDPVSACSNVRAGGRQVVRELDPCTMNRGNCSHALYFTQPAPGSCFTAGGTPAPSANLPAEPTAAEKEGFLRKWLNRTKSDLGLAAEHPGEAAKGAIKGQVNMVPELGEMMAQGSALQHAAEMEEKAVLMRMFGSSRAADQMQASAEALRHSADRITFPKLDMSHPAAVAGDNLFTAAQFITGAVGLVKSGIRAGLRTMVKSGRALAGEMDDAAGLAAKASSAAAGKADDAAGLTAKGTAGATGNAADVAETGQSITREGEQLTKAGDVGKTAAGSGGVRVVKMSKGYRYEMDELGRVRKVEGELKRNPAQGRNKRAQLDAGGRDRLPTDEGGHYAGRRFDGPTEEFNHFAQDQNFNRGAYKALENKWDAALQNGRSVRVEIVPNYTGNSLRPDSLNVKYWIDGRPSMKVFFNRPGG